MKNQSIKKLTNGNIESTATYPEVIVEVTYNGDKHKLGKQPSYNVLNIIEKKNVVHLKLYLEEQYKELEKKYIAFGEAMKPFDGIIFRDCSAAYVGIVFYANDKAKREFWFIEIDNVMALKTVQKSITLKNCQKLGFELKL